MASVATSEAAPATDAGERPPASARKDGARPPARPASLPPLLTNPDAVRPGGPGPGGRRIPGKAQLLKEIQRSYGNAYAQKVIEMYRSGGAGKDAKDGAGAGGGKGGKGGDEKAAGGKGGAA